MQSRGVLDVLKTKPRGRQLYNICPEIIEMILFLIEIPQLLEPKSPKQKRGLTVFLFPRENTMPNACGFDVAVCLRNYHILPQFSLKFCLALAKATTTPFSLLSEHKLGLLALRLGHFWSTLFS